MIDAERPRFGEGAGHRVVDLAARGKVRPERFFERKADVRAGQPRALQPVDRRLEQRRRGREENGETLVRVNLTLERREISGTRRVQLDVGQPLGERGGLLSIEKVGGDVGSQGFESLATIGRSVERAARGRDDLEPVGKQAVDVKSVKRRQQHPVRKIAGRAE